MPSGNFRRSRLPARAHRGRRVCASRCVALLYLYLYILLLNEDYALLIGSIGLFATLAAIMYATRRVNWYAVGVRPPTSSTDHPSRRIQWQIHVPPCDWPPSWV
ncbi:MAG: inner membrane CreD family protein [Candidatus Eisenbacteria bacterium]|nr:inner membrane CreD family protein [Candidatus Eisenbacteria bacterium]